MSKKKKTSPYGKGYTAEQFRQEQKYGAGYTPEEFSKYVAQQAAEERRRQQQIQAERERMQRVVSTYSMNRARPAPWAPGSSLDRLNKDAETIRTSRLPKYNENDRGYPASYIRQPEEKKPEPVGMKDWSAAANLLDPKSGMNQWIGNRPQAEQDYWSNIRGKISAQMEAQQRQANRADSLLNPKTPAGRRQGISALMQDAEQIRQSRADQENGTQGMNMTQLGMRNQMSTPGSPMYDALIRDRKKKEEEAKQNFAMMGKYLTAEGMLGDADANLGEWGGNATEEYKRVMSVENAEYINQAIEEARRAGVGNQTGDIYTMNKAGRDKWRMHLTNEKNMLSGQRLPFLQDQIKKLDEESEAFNHLTTEEKMEKYGSKYRTAYDKYLTEMGYTEEEYPLEYFIDDHFYYESDERYKELNSRITATQLDMENHDQEMAELDRLDRMEENYTMLMDPNAKKAKASQLESEIAALEEEMNALEEKNESGTDLGDNWLWEYRQEENRIWNALQEKQDELQRLNSYGELGSGEGDTTFHAEYDRGQNPEDEAEKTIVGKRKKYSRTYSGPMQDASVHGIYSFINHGNEYRYWEAFNEGEVDPQYRGAMVMVQAERDRFTELYNQAVSEGREPVEAQAFLDGLQSTLNQRLRTFEELRNKQAARRAPISASIASLMNGTLFPVYAAATMIGRATDADWAKDPYSQFFAPARFQSDVEGQIAKDAGDFGILYKAGMSGLKNMLRGLPFAGAGATIGSIGTLTEFFGENYYSSYQQKLEETGNADVAGAYALTDSFIGTLFEVASVEKMFSDPTDLLEYVLKNAGAEMSEEFFEGVFSPYIHKMVDGSDEIRENARRIQKAGGYTDASGNWVEVDPQDGDEAMRIALQQYNAQVAESVVSAGLSAGGAAGFGLIRNSVNENQYEKGLGKRATSKYIKPGMNLAQKKNARIESFNKLKEASLQMPEGSESRKIAEDIDNDIKNNKAVSFRKEGKLIRAIMNETNQKMGKIAEDVLGDTVENELISRGVGEEDAKKYGALIKDAIISGEMNPMAAVVLYSNQTAFDLWKEYNRKEEVQSARRIQKSVLDMITEPKQGVNADLRETVAAKMVVENWAQEKDRALQEALGNGEKRTGNQEEVVVNGRIGDLTGFGVKQTTDADGNVFFTVTAQVKFGENTEEVNLSDVQSTNEAGAMFLKFMQDEEGQSIGSNLGTAVMKLSGKFKDMAGATSDVINLLQSEYMGTEAETKNLDEEQKTAILNAIHQDMAEEDQKRAARRKELKPGQGTATINGHKYGTKGFSEELDKLGKTVKQEATYVANMLKTIGMDAEFYYNEKEAANQGVYIGADKIRINLAGTFTKDGKHRSAVATAGHEALHWLAANSPETYREMRKFVMNHLQADGFNVQAELKHIMANYKQHGEYLTLGDAIEEMTAMSNEGIFTNEKLIAELKEEDPTLYGKVQHAVRRAITQLRNILQGTRETSSRYAWSMQSAMDEISEKWKLMYNAAKGVQGAGESKGERHSRMISDNNGNKLSEGQREFFKNSKAVDKNGNLVKLYHGTNAAGFFEFNKTDDIGYFFTDSPGTASTYSDTFDEFAPKRAESWEDVNKLIRNDGYEYRKGDDGRYRLFDTSTDEDMSIWSGSYAEDDYNTAMEKDVWETIARENNKKLNYAVYANMENPLIIEGNDSVWNGVVDGTDGDMYLWDELTKEQQKEIADNAGLTLKEAKAQGWTEDGTLEVAAYDVRNMEIRDVMTTREWVAQAKEEGYDGVIFRDIQDEGQYGGGMPQISDVYVVMNPNQVKSVNNLNPTEESNDIRYSFMDDEYMNAVNRGDMETAQRLVDEAAKAAFPNSILIQDGEFKKMWHHTNAEFTEFLPGVKEGPGRVKGIYFTPQEHGSVASRNTSIHKQYYLNVESMKFAFGVAKDAPYVEDLRKRQEGVTDREEIARINREYSEETGVDALFDWQNGWYTMLNPENIKAADPVTYDDAGNVIPLSERFNTSEGDIRYSFSDNEIRNENGEVLAEVLPGNTITKYSYQTWMDEDIDSLTRQLIEQGFKKKDVTKWIRDVNGVAAMIAERRDVLDYDASPYFRMLKNNQEYVKTLDASTLCAKRLLYQGIFNEIQSKLPNTPLMPQDLIKLINMMKEKGHVTPCGFCYVESRRKMLGKYAQQWLDSYEGENKPQLKDVTTTDGLEALRKNNPEAYDSFIEAMKAKGSANPKVVETRTAYRGEIREMTDGQIRKVKEIGGLRVQSFSDFEVIHMIDMMQAVLDMAAKDLTSQAYTKVPEFAWVFGDTGMKINLSLVGKGTGLDADGKLVFDDVEGMPWQKAMELRKRYSKNVGTILVGINEAHIIAAMGDDTIDFIIPFHKSGWNKRELTQINGLSSYKDFTRWQNEKRIGSWTKNGVKTIPNKTSKISNFGPVNPGQTWDGQNGYWDFNKTGEENAREYLRLCKEDGRVPKFANFLEYDGEGGYRLPEGDDKNSRNIRKGYWKLLIDFKMYDNAGKGSPQTTVQPKFNMDAARDILTNYNENARSLPTDHELADQYVKEYKEEHPGREVFSIMDETDYDVAAWMESVPEWSLQTEAEKSLLRNYKDLRMKMQLDRERMRKVQAQIAQIEARPEAERSQDDRRRLEAYRIRLQNMQGTQDITEAKLAKITQDEGFGGLMYRQQKVVQDLLYNKTQGEVTEAVGRMEQTAKQIAARIEQNRKAVDELEKNGLVQKFRELLGTTTADKAADEIRKNYHSSWTKNQIKAYLEPIIIKMKNGEDFQQDVEDLAGAMVMSDMRNIEMDEDLQALRGLRIRLGEGQMRELKAQGSSLREVRARLAGTGIVVVPAKVERDAQGNVISRESSTLEQDIDDLISEYGNAILGDLGEEKDALETLITRIEKRIEDAVKGQNYDQRLAEAMAVITGKAAGAAKGIYMPNDPKAQKQVLAMMDFVKSLSAETAEAQKTLADIAEQMAQMEKAGQEASTKASVLMRDANVALDYYSRIGKIAVDEAKQKRTSALVEQLKSKQAQQILKNNEEWRALIQRDADARKQMEENRKYRSRMNTVMKRTMNLLKNPKGLQNIPEHMQGLARELMRTLVDNDLGGRKLTLADRKQLEEAQRLLTAWEMQDGAFNMADLQAKEDENFSISVIISDLNAIYEGIAAWNSEINGKNKLDTLKQRGEILRGIQEAVSEIYSAIKAEQEVQIGNRRVAVEDAAYAVEQGTKGKRFREWSGKAGQKLTWLHKAIVSGNMTPEYFFRSIGNEGMSALWDNYHRAENRNGLELRKAQERLAEIAEKYGYKNWDTKQRIKLELESGPVEMTLGQVMSLWATWKREIRLGPAMSEHLTKGGFYAEQDLRDGVIGRQTIDRRAHRVTEEDMQMVKEQLTEEQRQFIDEIVQYMSSDMSELGNEASMAAYGIRMYKEQYYFPFQMWDGVKSRKSNDAGAAAGSQDRAFHPSFSKSRMHGANNALVIGDFMQTAADHIAGMINYATMGLANEMMQKTMNYQATTGEDAASNTKRNGWTIFEEAYGQTASRYLRELQVQLNGGAVRIEKTIYDKLISLFRKNAVAGSLSVALQQPLSYIRAAMMINPKYLTAGVMKEYWKGSYQELIAHSGVAVIKDMGKFDMNAGQTAREYLMPDGMKSTGRKVVEGVGKYSTILPEKMDAWTWTRMWVAVKAEQHAAHPEMDMKSEEFLNMCGERFNDVMRRTQVYDSTLVRSANMRSQNPFIKQMTSFMAEPTLTLNVLADAVRSAKNKEAGGIQLAAKAGATYILSAILQAAVKGVMGSGRNPDEKKTWFENFMYRFGQNAMSEMNPLGLIPGYSDLVTLLKNGKLEDDAMGAVGKMFTAVTSTKDVLGNLLNGGNSENWYRDVEDSIGQLLQIFTNVPVKNIMRDARAIWNWTIERPYADRPNSGAVLRYQMEQALQNTDSLYSAALQMAGFKTTNAAYYERIYQAKKAGNEQAANDMIEYLLKGKNVEQKTIDSGVTSAAKKDSGASAEDTANFIIEEGGNADTYIKDKMRKGELTAEEARDLLQKADPEKDKDSIWWTVDRIQYQLDTGAEKVSGNYYRLWDAMNNNKAEDIRSAVKTMTDHGMEPKNIKTQITKQYKDAYLKATGNEKVKIKDAIEKAYKELGYSKEDADKVINSWK